MFYSRGSGDEGIELVEERAPAALVVVARGFVEELGVMEDHQRTAAFGLERYGDERLPLRRRVPGPGEHQPFVRHDLAIDPAGLEIFAVVANKADPVAASDTDVEIGLHARGLHVRRAEP